VPEACAELAWRAGLIVPAHPREALVIHELRTYHCMPGRLSDVLVRFETATLPLFARHGIRPLGFWLGFWTVLVGESSEDLIFLLEWESMADRETRWTAFQNDPEWVEARAHSERNGPIIASASNTFLKPTIFPIGAN
jgi:hypothetical protein